MKTTIISILFLVILSIDNIAKNASSAKGNNSNAQLNNQELSTDALKKGEIVAISDIISVIADNYRGKVMDVRLFNLGEFYVYKLKFLSSNHEIYYLYFDAKTKKMLDYNKSNFNDINLP